MIGVLLLVQLLFPAPLTEPYAKATAPLEVTVYGGQCPEGYEWNWGGISCYPKDWPWTQTVTIEGAVTP